MKNLFVLFVFLSTTTLFAQSNILEQSIEQALSQITSQTSQKQWQNLVPSFEQIAIDHSQEWQAKYYLAYANMSLAGTYEDQTLPIVAEYLDKAQAALDKANILAPNNAEIITLQGFIYMGRIWESPFMNGGLYGRKISKLFQQAIEIDPANPRAYYLKGLLTFHTPRFVGGGKEKAKPWLITAQEKFDNFNFPSNIAPNWGTVENASLLEECGGVIAKSN